MSEKKLRKRSENELLTVVSKICLRPTTRGSDGFERGFYGGGKDNLHKSVRYGANTRPISSHG